MTVITYNKAVRDRIPEIIRASGKECTVEQVPPERWLELLNQKLAEEVAEYQANPSLEELADILEIMQTIVALRGETWEELERVRVAKAEERGGFRDRILLQAVV
jgi:predicted house-cleaning noncanonical NTP pyrophosphatase (MazG superfamily)